MCKVWNLHEGWIPYRMAAARPPKEEITVAPGGRVRWRTPKRATRNKLANTLSRQGRRFIRCNGAIQ